MRFAGNWFCTELNHRTKLGLERTEKWPKPTHTGWVSTSRACLHIAQHQAPLSLVAACGCRCCQAQESCSEWKSASQASAASGGDGASSSGGPAVDTDLCQFGSCDVEGRLTSLNLRGWQMACPFPGDIFEQFPDLQSLHLSFNNFTVSTLCSGAMGWSGVGSCLV